MSHKMLILKAGIDFILVTPPPFSTENQFRDGIDSHKESILWNQCLESLKVSNFGLRPERSEPKNFGVTGLVRMHSMS